MVRVLFLSVALRRRELAMLVAALVLLPLPVVVRRARTVLPARLLRPTSRPLFLVHGLLGLLLLLVLTANVKLGRLDGHLAELRLVPRVRALLAALH